MQEELSTTRRRTGSPAPFLVCIGCLLALAALLLLPDTAQRLVRIEHWTADWRTAYLSDRLDAVHPKLAIVGISDETLADYPYILPPDRGLLARIVTAVNEAGARAIGLDFYFYRESEEQKTEQLIAAIRQAKDKIVLGAFFSDRLGPKFQKFQSSFLEKAQAHAGLINAAPDSDRVIRNKPGDKDSFFAILSRIAGASGEEKSGRIAWLLPPAGGETFLHIKAHDLLGGAVDRALLRDRIVLVGGEFPYIDRHWTPLSIRTGDQMSGIEIHAHMVAELVDADRSYSELSTNSARLFSGFLAALGIVLGWRFQRRNFDFLDWRVASFGLVAIDAVAFKFAHIVLPWTLVAFAWLLAVTLGTQLRQALAWAFASRGDDR